MLFRGVTESYFSSWSKPQRPHIYSYATTLYLPKSDLPRQTEASTEHLLLGTNQPHIVNGEFQFLVTLASHTVIDSDLVPDTLGDSLADIDVIIHLVIGAVSYTHLTLPTICSV